MKQRIQKVLAAAGVASRRHVEEMVVQGRISVNGEIVTSLPIMVDPQRDRITVDDEPVRVAKRVSSERVYLIMNKPRGVYSTNVAQGEQTRAIDLFRQATVPIIGLVENMAGYACPHCGEVSDPFGAGGAEQAAAALEAPFLGRIPLEIAIRKASDAGQPPAAGGDPLAQPFLDIAGGLMGWLNAKTAA